MNIKSIEMLLNESLKAHKVSYDSLPLTYLTRLSCNYPAWYKAVQISAMWLHVNQHEYAGALATSVADSVLVVKAVKSGTAKKEMFKLTLISCFAYGLSYMGLKDKK